MYMTAVTKKMSVPARLFCKALKALAQEEKESNHLPK